MPDGTPKTTPSDASGPAPQPPLLRTLAPEDDPALAELIRVVMTEQGADVPGTAIHDPEVAAMSAAYPPPRAGYFVLERAGRVVGGAGFGPLAGGPADTCELRKMYLFAETRGAGHGRRLLHHVLAAARAAGYRRCYLETFDHMRAARALYESEGFLRLDARLGATGHFACQVWYAREL